MYDDYEDVLRRAELFDRIAEMIRSTKPAIRSTSEDSIAYTADPTASPAAIAKTHPMLALLSPPRLMVAEHSITWQDSSLDLARRPMILKLFRAFCEAPDYCLSRNQVIEIIYGKTVPQRRSTRYMESVHSNIIKLISRARILANSAFAASVGPDVEWFVYHQERRSWSLLQKRVSCIPDPLRMVDDDDLALDESVSVKGSR